MLYLADSSGNAATNNITIIPTGAAINGSGTFVLNSDYQFVTLTCDGTNWFVSTGGGGSTPGLPVIIGQNALTQPMSACVDDVPEIQAFINANPGGSAVTLVNVCLKSKIDFSPWTSTGSLIQLAGVTRYTYNAGEFELFNNMTVRGLGGGLVNFPRLQLGIWSQ